MIVTLHRNARERRMLDERRQTRAMRWIMGVMLFLTVLAGAVGLGTAGAVRTLDRQLAGRLTVQIVEPEARARAAQTEAVVRMLREMPGVARVQAVAPERLAELLRPWLGEVGLDADLPIPALIDVDLRASTDQAVAELDRAVRALAPSARVDRHARWLSPVRDFIAMLAWLAGGMVLLMAAATTFVVILTARSGLDTHRDTIDVLHMLGSTDIQVARLFQRRIALDTLVGGGLGALVALALAAFLQTRLAALGSAALGGAALRPVDWAMLAALPFVFTLLAMLAARTTVVGALRKML